MKWIGKNSLSDTSLSDITSVIAGTGLSGGGTTGDVTLNVNVNHDSLAGFVAAEHVDWASAEVGSSIHTSNIPRLDQDTTGTAANANLAAQATILATARAINGVDFNGAEGITVTAAAGTLSGEELKSTVTGSALASVGVITSGEWRGTTISQTYLTGQSGTNTGDETLSSINALDITEVGTISSGQWRGDAITSLYLDSDTAHLTTTQVFTGDKTFSTKLSVFNSTTSSATQGGKLNLISNDGAALGDDHRLGIVNFIAAEDASDGYVAGASIAAYADAAWSDSENGTRLVVRTMDGNASGQDVLTLDSDKLATFTGAVTVTGALSGTLATVSQPNITGVGTIGTGVWNGTAIASAYIAGDAINGDKIADEAVDSEHYTDGSIDTAHIADAQITVAKLHADAVQTSGESFADNDTSLMTSASINDRVNRPDKQIVLMRAGFKDDVGTSKHYVPLQSDIEKSDYYQEVNSFVAPFAGKLLKVMYRASANLSGGNVAFTLEQIDRNKTFLTTPDVLETITIAGPTNNTTDPNMVTANFVGGGGTNAFVAGDQIMLGMQFDTDVTGSSARHFFTLVFEFDFSGVAQ